MPASIDPWKEMERMRREVERLVGRFGFPTAAYQFPMTNIYDNRNDIVVIAELPGVSKDDITINFYDGVLTISGRRRIHAPARAPVLLCREQREGEFDRSISIPVTVRDKDIRATFSEGLLKVVLPKSDESKPKRIEVQS